MSAEALARIDAALAEVFRDAALSEFERVDPKETYESLVPKANALASALRAARAEIVRQAALIPESPADDEREALIELGEKAWVAWVDSPEIDGIGPYIADAVLASAVWRYRHRGPITDEAVDRVAAAIAKAADADYWVDEIAEWENSEEWERAARADDYPQTAYEDRAFYRMQASAALEAGAAS